MAFAQNSHTELNPIQVSLLRLFNRPMSEQEAIEIKQLLVDHYANELDEELNQVISQKGYTQKDFDNLLNEGE